MFQEQQSPVRAPRGAGSAEVSVLQHAVEDNSAWVHELRAQLARVVVGQKGLVDRLLVALLTSGHVLVEGLPGLGPVADLRVRDRRHGFLCCCCR